MMNDVRSKKTLEASESATATSAAGPLPSFDGGLAYHEIASDAHLVRVDVLEQLKSNIVQLEDLHGRLHFMMGEIGTLLKRS